MSDPKEIQQQDAIHEGKSQVEELSERDLEKAAGGGALYDESPKE